MLGTLREKLDCTIFFVIGNLIILRKHQPMQIVEPLLAQIQSRARCHHDLNITSGCQDIRHQIDALQQMLEVIQEEQDTLVLEVIEELLARLAVIRLERITD